MGTEVVSVCVCPPLAKDFGGGVGEGGGGVGSSVVLEGGRGRDEGRGKEREGRGEEGRQKLSQKNRHNQLTT